MKKLLIALTFVAFSMTVMGQKMVLVLDSIEYMKSIPCNHNHACSEHTHIFGICSTEDIGGVMTEFETSNGTSYGSLYLYLTNRNAFPVTVLVKYSYDELPSNVRAITLDTMVTQKIRIGFEGYLSKCYIHGLIVRKFVE